VRLKKLFYKTLKQNALIKQDILFDYINAEKFGLKTDIRKDIYYYSVGTMTYENVKKFQDEKIKNKPATILILGKKEMLDIKTLEKYGTVKYLTLKDVFGY
jgi:hypothetical protein